MAAAVDYLAGDAAGTSRSSVAHTAVVTAYWLDRMLPGDLVPLLARVRMIGSSAAGEPVLAHTALAGLGRVATGAAVPALLAALRTGPQVERAPLATVPAVLQPGMRTRIALDCVAAVPPFGVACELDPSADGGRAALALELRGPVLAATDDDAADLEPGAAPAARRATTEVAVLRLLDALVPGDAGTLLLVRGPEAGLWCALHVQVRAQAPDAAALAAAGQRLRTRQLALDARGARLTAAERARHEFEGAVASLAVGHEQRAALVFLAQVLGAPLAADLALTCDTFVLLDWAAQVHAELEPHPRPDAAALGWALERTASQTLLQTLAEGGARPGLRAVLLRHAGEAGNAGDVLDALLLECRDVATFQRRLVQENLQFLADTRPGARTRAADWLRGHGRLPAGFDPLGAPAARRAALEALDAAEAAR